MTPPRALIVAPHPDDEVLGCTSVLQGRRCVVLHVTGGVPSEPSEASPTVEARVAESVAAARVLGATIDDRVLLGFGDQRVWPEPEAVAAALAAVVERTAPADVYVPAYQNGHPDHDGTFVAAQLARARVRKQARWWAFGLYGVDHAGRYRFDHLDPGMFPEARRRPLDAEVRSAKAAALRCFGSQTGPGTVLERWLSAPADEVTAVLPAPDPPLPALPCYYEQAFPDRCGLSARTVRATLDERLSLLRG